MNPEDWAARNPFTNQYAREEASFYGLAEYENDGMRVHTDTPVGRLDDYLNLAFSAGNINTPILTIDGSLWMSLTRMECQSQHLPIQFADGRVGTVGLGLGHFTLRAMEKPSVDTVLVYERDPRIIAFFKDAFKDRAGFDKVVFIEGDARKTCQGEALDFLYVDCYPTCCGDEVITDIELFIENNDLYNGPDSYHFWGMERALLDAVMLGMLDFSDLDWPTQKYFGRWAGTPVEGVAGGHLLKHLYRTVLDPGFISDVLSRLGYSVGEPTGGEE